MQVFSLLPALLSLLFLIGILLYRAKEITLVIVLAF